MWKLLLTLPFILLCNTAQSNVLDDQTKIVLGQLLLMDAFSRTSKGTGILKTPVINLENTLNDWQLMNPHKTCYISPQYHSNGSVTPHLRCH
jgi:hypothetical protein